MDKQQKKELAAKMAAQRTAGAGGARKPLPNAAPARQQDGFSFFGSEADGWNMSPKTILLFSVAYMGAVILLHIFAKITSINKAATGGAEDAAGDL